MKNFADLFANVRLIDEERRQTDQGEITVLYLESETNEETLSITVTIPSECRSMYPTE